MLLRGSLLICAAATLVACSSPSTPAASAAATATASTAASGPYLHELLQRPAPQRAWQQLLGGSQAAPWIVNGEGPTEPAATVTLGGHNYWQGSVCERHNCPNTFFYLLSEQRAYGLHADFTQPRAAQPTFYGEPPAAERAALQQAFEAARARHLKDLPPAR